MALNVPLLGEPLVSTDGSALRCVETRIRAMFPSYVPLNHRIMTTDLEVAGLSKRLQFAQRDTVSYVTRRHRWRY